MGEPINDHAAQAVAQGHPDDRPPPVVGKNLASPVVIHDFRAPAIRPEPSINDLPSDVEES
jgi:hypothetical protein